MSINALEQSVPEVRAIFAVLIFWRNSKVVQSYPIYRDHVLIWCHFGRPEGHYYCRSIAENYRAPSHGGANQELLEEFDIW